ncbi:hypothetical protein Bbelb_011310 [Branchiostoma belcheri]|nr:hypothetical protein Bbelb_011310 [Branchiostoma belcheri]
MLTFSYLGQPKLCHKCGGEGHFVASCVVQKCSKCFELGHLARDCTRSIKCNVCGGEEGHTGRGCQLSFANRLALSTSWAGPQTLPESLKPRIESSSQDLFNVPQSTPNNGGDKVVIKAVVHATDQQITDQQISEKDFPLSGKVSAQKIVEPDSSLSGSGFDKWDLGSLPEDGANKLLSQELTEPEIEQFSSGDSPDRKEEDKAPSPKPRRRRANRNEWGRRGMPSGVPRLLYRRQKGVVSSVEGKGSLVPRHKFCQRCGGLDRVSESSSSPGANTQDVFELRSLCSDLDLIDAWRVENPAGTRPWKCNVKILSDPVFKQEFLEKYPTWVKEDGQTLREWWEVVKQNSKDLIIKFSKQRAREAALVQRGLERELDVLRSRINVGDRTPKTSEEYESVRERLRQLIRDRLSGQKLRAKVKAFEEDEKPTRFFFKAERSKDRQLNLSELETAVKGMENGKSPGSDGLPKEFYVQFWEVLGPDLLAVLNEGLGDALANRLKDVIGTVVHTDQSCGIPGRSIDDSVCLLRDIVEYVNGTESSCVLIALDQEKAFDRVSHDFMAKPSIDRTFETIGRYEAGTGSKLNMGKTEALWLGSWRGRRDEPYPIKRWTSDSLTILGSPIVKIEKEIHHFLWDGKTEVVARRTLLLPKEKGGWAWFLFHSKAKALLLKSVKKALANPQLPVSRFAHYWIGLALRRIDVETWSNNAPHSLDCPAYFAEIKRLLNSLADKGIDWKSTSVSALYNILLEAEDIVPCVLGLIVVWIGWQFGKPSTTLFSTSGRG